MNDIRHNLSQSGADSEGKICLGIILAAHGIKGEVKVKSYTQNPEDIKEYTNFLLESETPLTVRSMRDTSTKDVFITTFEQVADRTEAERLKGTKIYISKIQLEELSEDEFYFEDLVGLAVTDNSEPDKVIGRVKAVFEFGAGPLLELSLEDDEGKIKDLMIPFSDAWVPEIYLNEGYIVVDEHYLSEMQKVVQQKDEQTARAAMDEANEMQEEMQDADPS